MQQRIFTISIVLTECAFQEKCCKSELYKMIDKLAKNV